MNNVSFYSQKLNLYALKAITEENVQWNEEIGEWQLKCVAYTGNNMRKVSQLIHSCYLWHALNVKRND